MINPKITQFISERMSIIRKDLVEKDVLLNQLLFHLASDKYFFENYALKGGTCLIKCYLEYYRFSEDLDFTYLNQKEFAGKSEKKIRELISEKIDNIAIILENIAKSIGLRFKIEKQNREYFQFGGSNAFVTFKLWYNSQELKRESFIKVQINYREKLDYPVKKTEAKFIVPKNLEKDFVFLYRDEAEALMKSIEIKSYDIREVLVEKIRAILTRKGVKARDFIDIYQITKSENIKIEALKKVIIDKTKAMMRFEKYKSNLDNKQKIDFSAEIDKDRIKIEEERILLINLPSDFDSFLDKFKLFLQELIEKI